MRCATPGPCSSPPQGHKTAFKFQRIRCTICFTSPDNHQKKKDHTWKSCACLSVATNVQKLKLQGQKRSFWLFRTAALCIEWMSRRISRDSRNGRTSWKRCGTVRPAVTLYVNELLIQICKFWIQVSRHWPQLGLPQMALWHHVGVTIGITIDKNGSLYDPAGTESWNMQIRWETN